MFFQRQRAFAERSMATLSSGTLSGLKLASSKLKKSRSKNQRKSLRMTGSYVLYVSVFKFFVPFIAGPDQVESSALETPSTIGWVGTTGDATFTVSDERRRCSRAARNVVVSAERPVPDRGGTELGVQRVTRRDQIAVELGPANQVYGRHDRLGGVQHHPGRGPRSVFSGGGHPRLHDPDDRDACGVQLKYDVIRDGVLKILSK